MTDAPDNVVRFPRSPLLRPRLSVERLRGRLGRFGISDHVIEYMPDTVLLVMSQVIVLQAARCPTHQGHIIYFGICEHFDPIVDGDQYPAYEWRFEKGCMRPYRLNLGPDANA